MDDSLAQMHVGRQHGHILCNHYVLSGGQQTLTQLSTRMELCKVLWTEMTLLHQCDGQCVAHGQRGCRTAGRCQIQRTGFLLYADIQVIGRIFRQERLWVATHANDGYLHVEHHRDKA